ncbi:leucine-rich repeat extensin-like protein 6 [Syzygium oleosum]|uniref:leucine-rich repeat extensin-like protein 6 n=1 Tax=Syzygium oleosum TaxID=219896 RepID=UPI0024B94A4C|nr:leucine-rich repeat extensin-like protein 6 [Syzygium oleosum]
MENWLLAFLLLLAMPIEAAYVGGGVGIGMGGGDAGVGSGRGGRAGSVWIGGGINAPAPSGSRLSNAYTALQAWKSAVTDDPNKIMETWVGSDVCSYKGVFCSDPQDGMGPLVAGIDLNKANVQGTLVKELSLLTDMTLLHLNSNRFSGSVPNTLRDLSSLQELDLSNNQFSGTFPAVVLEMPNLIYLDLRFNSFSGPIPEDLFNRKLDAIFVNNNNFEGELPQNLGNSQASVINLANNKFSGSIPASFGLMASKLKEILFLNNQLSGCIPQGIGLFTEMKVFDVSYNSLIGHLPDTLSCLSQVEVLNLGHNKLSGELPDLVCSLKSLMNLTVAYNFLSELSQECTKLFFRSVGFDFSVNCIPNKDMQRPQPECSSTPGGGPSCLRIPSVQPHVCGTMAVLSGTASDLTSMSP